MMAKSTSYHTKLIQDLQDPLESANYIEVVLDDTIDKIDLDKFTRIVNGLVNVINDLANEE